ncbi:Retrovirus-related Pol polyprotein from transposon TNT 1-94 [Vitis vinifera]|uniref:Retrovirus-related Pol polyprotein from transposon TNT 1-94 n=1 Tax=Vitis vinifera TaxID=29760 RepID=A0A438IJN9_VITVI|nr:Retrovirus-related Pol polyprotein from transposon TNT 1-94 [Vitis vinifera]
MGQGYEDHLVTQEADILEVERVQWRKIDAQLCQGLYTNDIQHLYKVAFAVVHISQQDLDLSTYIGQIVSLKEEFLVVMPLTPDVGAQQTQLDKFFMVLTLIGLRPDLEPVRDQILGSSSVQSLDMCLLASFLHGRPPRTAHVAQSSDSQLPQSPSSSASQVSQAFVASVAQPGDASACLTHTSSLGPWILDSGASDHLSGIGLALPLPSLPLTSVIYTPECPFNLISISKITRTLNCSITFFDKFVTLQDRSTGKTIGIGRESQGLYHLTSDSSPAVCISTDAPLLIHNRLGHPSLSKFQKMVLVFPLCRRFVDNAREYFSAPFTSFMSHHGILHQSSCAHTPQQNGVAERKNRHLVETARTILLHSNVPFRFWGDAVLTACYLINRQAFRQSHEVPLLGIFQTSEGLALPIVSPSDVVPPRPLQVYHRRPRVAAPLPFAEAPADSLPIPSASPAPALPSPDDLPIAIRKGTRSTRNPHPIYNFLSYHRLSSPYSAFVSAISSVSLPKSTHEALSHPGWRQAMVDEMAALHSNGTWDLVVLPSGKSTVGCRWVYAVKVGPDGQIASVRLLLSMAAMCSWPLYQLDIKNVFLHGDLAEEVYMEQPPGFVAQGESGLVCSTVDHSVFYHHNSLGQCIYLIVYVDDIVITGSDQDDSSIQFRCGPFPKKYALDILERTGMLDCKPINTPMDPNVNLLPGQGEPLGDPGRYRRLSPCDSHWDVVIRILRYIKSTPGQGVLYENRGHTQVWLHRCRLSWLHPQIDVPLQGTVFLLRPHYILHPIQSFMKGPNILEVDCHFIREKIASGCVSTSFVNSNDQLADIFTKSLRGPRIKYICNKLGAYDIYAPLEGEC